MRFAVFICCLLLAAPALAQTHKAHKPPVAHKMALPAVPDSLLVGALTNEVIKYGTTDSLKALAIYRWVATNIAYDDEELKNVAAGNGYPFLPHPPVAMTQAAYEDWATQIIVLHVLKTGKAICDGYSRLYKAMCDAAHVECVMVTGWGRVDKSMPGYSESPDSANHAWNAIRVNGNWHNVDACWGHPDNGYDIGLYYFCTPPEQLIYDHYPENGKWALLPVVPSLKDFFASPRLYPAYFSSGVKVLYPRIGTIQGPAGRVVNFRIVGANQPVYPEIVQMPNDSVLAYHEDEQSHVTYTPQELERTKPYHYNPKISKKEKQAVDAIMDYVNSLPASDSNAYQPSAPYHDTTASAVSDVVETLPGEALVINGNTVSFKYLLPRDGVKEIDIFVNGKAIATYDVVIQQGQ